MNITFISTDGDSLALGMRSVSATLKAAGHQTRLVFMGTNKKLYSNKTLEKISSLVRNSDVVGFSCLAQGSAKTKQTIESLRPLNKLIVWGGVHACLNPADCADWADVVCRGEGEGMMLELMDRLAQGKDWKDMKNAAYKENGILIENDLAPLIKDLDELPLPDFSFDNEYYLIKHEFKKVIGLDNVDKNGQIVFTSSRGCAFRCTYCCNVSLKSMYSGKEHYVRRMSVPRLIEHSQNLRRIFPKGNYFYFVDEDFAARPLNELLEFADEFPKKVGLPVECLAHPARITEQKMDLLVKAGVYRIRMGIESGSERTKKEIYDRHVSNEAALHAAKIISHYPNVSPVYFFIIANPYEEKDDLLATLQLIKTLPYGSNIQAFNLIFFPGSSIYERAVRDGLIHGKEDSGYELDYHDGFRYKGYSWKKKNMYLNGLLVLAEGLCTRSRVGTLPRFMLSFLIRPNIIDFNERHPSAIKVLIFLKNLLLVLRHMSAGWLKQIVRNPTMVYNLGYFFRKKISPKSYLSRKKV